MDNDEVVIIGAGISGLATAIALHKKGIKCVVMERSETLRNTTGSAILIRLNGWRALEQLGVANTLRHTAIPVQRERNVWLDKGKEQELLMDGETLCLRRKDLIDTLYAALPSGTVKLGCQLESIKLDPNTTTPVLRFIDGSSLIAKVVIGCDGANSVVADVFNLNPLRTFSYCATRGLTSYSSHSFGSELTRFLSNNNVVGRIAVDDNLVYWFSKQPGVPTDERIWKDPEVLRQTTLELTSSYPHEIQHMIKNADPKSLSIARLKYRAPWDLLTGTFCKGTVTLAGDAMHVMGPFLGQGGSAGLEDAVVLARNLANVITLDPIKIGEAFDLYVKQRRMRVVLLSLQNYLIGMLYGTPSCIHRFICTALLAVFFRNPSCHIHYDCGRL